MIYIAIRKTLDWREEKAFQDQIPDNMRAGIALWNATFDMPYHLFRYELKRIAQCNLSRIEGALCVPPQEIHEISRSAQWQCQWTTTTGSPRSWGRCWSMD